MGVIDILPTVLDYLEAIEAPQVEGLSLRPLIEGQARLGRQALFAESSYFFNSYAVLMGHQKLVANRVLPVELFRPSLFLANLRSIYKYRKDEFFQLDRDPSESDNVVDQMQPRLDTFRTELRLHLQGVQRGDQTLLDEETLEELKTLGYIR